MQTNLLRPRQRSEQDNSRHIRKHESMEYLFGNVATGLRFQRSTALRQRERRGSILQVL